MSSIKPVREAFWPVAFVLILLSLALSACAPTGAPAVQPTPQDGLAAQSSEVSASGEVVPARWATLSFPSGATALDFTVKVGDFVAQNQPLVKSNDQALRAARAQSQALVDKAALALRALKDAPSASARAAAAAALASAKANQARLKDADASDIDLEAAQAQVDSAQAALDEINAGASEQQIAAAEQDLTAARAALVQAEQALANATLTAPFAGQVIAIYPNPFEAIGPAQPVLLLADPATYQVETTDLSEVDLARVKVGNAARVSFDALPNQTFTGKVDRIALKSAGGSAVYYKVTIKMDEIPQGLRWGMTAFVVMP